MEEFVAQCCRGVTAVTRGTRAGVLVVRTAAGDRRANTGTIAAASPSAVLAVPGQAGRASAQNDGDLSAAGVSVNPFQATDAAGVTPQTLKKYEKRPTQTSKQTIVDAILPHLQKKVSASRR